MELFLGRAQRERGYRSYGVRLLSISAGRRRGGPAGPPVLSQPGCAGATTCAGDNWFPGCPQEPREPFPTSTAAESWAVACLFPRDAHEGGFTLQDFWHSSSWDHPLPRCFGSFSSLPEAVGRGQSSVSQQRETSLSCPLG